MSFAPVIIIGRRGTYRLSDPAPRLDLSRDGPDQLTDAWQSDVEFPSELDESRPHPLYPGLLLNNRSHVEECPEYLNGEATGLGSYQHDCTWIGNARNNATTPDKLLSTSETRQLEQGFETFTETRLTWHGIPKDITGDASTDVIACPRHGFADGRRVCLIDLTGGSGLTAHTTTTLSTIYYIINATADGFQISATLGGSAVNFTTNITAGKILPAEYCPGSVHPTYAQMFLTSVQLRRTGADEFHTVECTYTGLRITKPYQRQIIFNGQVVTSSQPMQVLLTGGWTDYLYTNLNLPRCVVQDTYVTAGGLATASVPDFLTPANAPTLPSYVFTGDEFVFNFPYGWTLVASEPVATLNSAITLMVRRDSYEYIWPALLR